MVKKIKELTEIAQTPHAGLISGYSFRSTKFTEAFAKLQLLKSQEIQLGVDIESLHLQQLDFIADIFAN